MHIPQRVLIIRAGALGDTLLALPAVAVLRRAWPAAAFEWLGYPGHLEWLKGTPFVDSCRSIDSSLFCHLFDGRADQRLLEFFRSFDFCICWARDPDRAVEDLLQPLFGAHCVRADPFPEPGRGIHAADHLLRTLQSIADPGLQRFLENAPVDAVLKGVRFGVAADPGCAPSQLRVMIHPGSGDRRKCWPLDRFQAVAESLHSEAGADPFWLLGPADGHLESGLRSYCSAQGVGLHCGMPVRELAGCLEGAAAFLGNDSGVSHLAAAVGTHAWVLFGPTAPEEWAPRGEHVRVIRDPAQAGHANGAAAGAATGSLERISAAAVSRSMVGALQAIR